jgi:hypothetical protein
MINLKSRTREIGNHLRTYLEMFGCFVVNDVSSVEGFISRYYKSDRINREWKEENKIINLRALIIQGCKDDIKEYGICWISHHDSVTGNVVSYIENKEISQ